MELEELAGVEAQTQSQRFVARVYGWMALGLAVTGIVSTMTASSPALFSLIAGHRFVFYGLLIGELVLVIGLSARLNRLSYAAASAFFLLYAVLTGLTLSFIFLIYTTSSIGTAFFATAGMFGAMSIIGYETRTDLTAIGNLCFMGLIGVILASVANWFLHNPTLEWVTTYLGIAVFVGLTAYDSQKIKRMGLSYGADALEGSSRNLAIGGALALYLDFINLFLMVLQLMGRRRS